MKTLITAHSGCEGTAMNSPAFFEAAFSSGADMLEIDVRMSPDGFLYLFHDLPPEGPESCVRLTDFFDLLKAHPAFRVNCDMKEEGIARAVMEEARRRDIAPRIVFTGSVMGEEAEIRSLGGEFWYGIWEREDFEPALSSMLATGAKILNLPHRFVTPENKARLDSLGLGFSCWTADREEDIRRLLSLGVYNITTRRPVLALALREEVQGETRLF